MSHANSLFITLCGAVVGLTLAVLIWDCNVQVRALKARVESLERRVDLQLARRRWDRADGSS